MPDLLKFQRPMGVDPLSPASGDAALIADLRAQLARRDAQVEALREQPRRIRVYWIGENYHVTAEEFLRTMEVLELAGFSDVRLRPFKQDGRFAGLELCATPAVAPLSAA